MKSMQFHITINAPVEKVWRTLLEQDTYRIWTAEFMAGSYYEGNWEQGSKILFLGPGRSGMTSVIAENRPHQYLSISHRGIVMGGVEDTESTESKAWAGASESYTFTPQGKGTLLGIELSAIPAEFEDYMAGAWPKALAKLKSICE
jgi:uncharacterized protein YndB with AHSA1/START domain